MKLNRFSLSVHRPASVLSACFQLWHIVSKLLGAEKRHEDERQTTDRYTISKVNSSIPQMYLAAVSVEVTGEGLHGKKKLSQLGGEQWEDFFHFCLSVWDMLIFLCELFILKRTEPSHAVGKLQHLQMQRAPTSTEPLTAWKDKYEWFPPCNKANTKSTMLATF